MAFDANAVGSSPTETDLETNAAAPAVTEGAPSDANPAASSTVDDKDANQPTDLLSVVKSAVAPAGDPANSSDAEGNREDEGATEANAAAAAAAEAGTDPDANLPFHNHPRWKEVIAERDSFKSDAEQFRNISAYCNEHGLMPAEVAEGFDIMAKLKSGSPEGLSEVREYFASRLALLDQHLGNVLPDDLQERVDSGEIDEGAAAEIAQLRAADKLRASATEQREQRDAAAEAERGRVASAEAMMTAVEGWEQRQKGTDPDYAKKAALVETTCRAIVQQTGKAPATPEEAVALAEQALKQVNQQFKSLLPAKRAVSPTPRSTSTPTVAQPKTLREAIAAAANGG